MQARPTGAALAMTVAGTIAVLASLAGIDARATYGARVTGDEPQYLVTATSIGEDLSLDVSDEIARRAYLPYHEIDLDPQTMALDPSGRQVSPHDPLLPALLAVPMRIGGWAAAKATLAIIAGITAALTAWVAIRRLGVSPTAAATAVGAAFAGIPLAAYGIQVYPEMPAALAVMIALACLTVPAPSWRGGRGAPAPRGAPPGWGGNNAPPAPRPRAPPPPRSWPRSRWPAAPATTARWPSRRRRPRPATRRSSSSRP
ncbi:MAG: hypothetical protein ABW328_15565, partial [Ilumatobacteraceae bacterium]